MSSSDFGDVYRSEANNQLEGLLRCIRRGDVKMVKDYLDNGVNPNQFSVKGCPGWTPVHLAATKKECLKLLFEYGGDPNAVTQTYGNTVMHIAAFKGDTECVKICLVNGADVFLQNNDGDIPSEVCKKKAWYHKFPFSHKVCPRRLIKECERNFRAGRRSSTTLRFDDSISKNKNAKQKYDYTNTGKNYCSLLNFNVECNNLISNQAAKIQSILSVLQCPVCLDTVQDPITLPCGHDFCRDCLKRLPTQFETYQCPICRARYSRYMAVQTSVALKNIAEATTKLQSMCCSKKPPIS